jgi:hypothetical protein
MLDTDFAGWKMNYNYWTGFSRKGFVSNKGSWCPTRNHQPLSKLPWKVNNLANTSLVGVADCLALTISILKTNVSTKYTGRLSFRNCSQRQMAACRESFNS